MSDGSEVFLSFRETMDLMAKQIVTLTEQVEGLKTQLEEQHEEVLEKIDNLSEGGSGMTVENYQ